MHRVAAKLLSRILTADQVQQPVDVCEELQPSLLGLLLVTRAEVTVILRQSNNPLNGIF
jgi:hypothetical protein